MSDYMKNQGLVDGITGCRNRQRELAKDNKRLINAVVTYEAEIERLRAVVDAARDVADNVAHPTDYQEGAFMNALYVALAALGDE